MTSGPYAGTGGAPWRAGRDIRRSWRVRAEPVAEMVKRGLRWIAAGAAAVPVVFWIWSTSGGPLSVKVNLGVPPSEKMWLAAVSSTDAREFLEPPPLTASAGSTSFDPPLPADEEATPQPMIAEYLPGTPAAHDHSRRQPATRTGASHRTHRRPGRSFAAPIFGYLAIR